MNLDIWLWGFIVAMVLFQLVAIPALILKKNDLADVLWGPGFPLTVAAAIYIATGDLILDLRSKIILALISIWALRLFLHVGIRNLSTLEEDVRYNNWRKQWGKSEVWRSYLQVFVLQPVILYVFLASVLVVVSSPEQPMTALAWLGVAAWMFGFLFETIGDEQLRRFKADKSNKGKLMTLGLWSWTRHPNYFGEVTMWWGIWLMALDLPYGWASIVAPIGTTFLILKVSGVDMLEDLMKKRPGFQEYAARTSKFLPLPPKKI